MQYGMKWPFTIVLISKRWATAAFDIGKVIKKYYACFMTAGSPDILVQHCDVEKYYDV
ncbi:hypothetical protein T4A_5457 [Trichinella pseudospiralis]|uniref:Uncharacterized protein n=1 Tax=Trichinella pseudospiralis TaxID=6337 RepID=A0A0V1CMZ2_TRIPS|nr:hypothetical protein T4A_5457 [Trichinella pseudospiralis]